MELDEMKSLWAQSNGSIEKSMRLNVPLLQQRNLGQIDTLMGRLKRGLILELVISVTAVAALAYFGYQHLREPRFLLPAALLYVYALAHLIAVARQLTQLSAVNYDEPVVSIQKKLEECRLARIRTTLWALLLAPLMWLPILVVGMRAAFGVNIYDYANTAWLAANVLLGLAVIPPAIFLARRYGPRLEGTTVMRRIADAIAGKTLSEASATLASIHRFEES